ncbi:hypothetical protein PVAP13_3NG279164 [Panicum virgatum]|uniref:Uncharacterized protein n=1 Tax=Panicum virgatum TaxID=38727 RepID=A0A8T0UDV0_PANVG|nr:hypothetical protein PVAP13_3NG279164 [Panicum virgatum]
MQSPGDGHQVTKLPWTRSCPPPTQIAVPISLRSCLLCLNLSQIRSPELRCGQRLVTRSSPPSLRSKPPLPTEASPSPLPLSSSDLQRRCRHGRSRRSQGPQIQMCLHLLTSPSLPPVLFAGSPSSRGWMHLSTILPLPLHGSAS